MPPEFLHLERPYAKQPIGGSVFSLLFMLVFTCLGVILLALAIGGHISERNEYRRLLREGVVVEGSVQALRVEEDDDPPTYLVVYEFTAPVNGNPVRFQGSQSVAEDFYRGLRLGQSISVRYAASRPELSSLEAEFGPPNLLFPLVIGGVGALGTLAGSAMAILIVRNRVNSRRLRQEGRRTYAFVFDRWGGRDLEGLPTYAVAYAFKAERADGEPVTVVRGVESKELYDRFQVGDAVPVLYLLSDPHICELILEQNG
ncbi:MAG: DUF3592 domain-containing protein [Caldilineales bacterium]|nr:DUF3592 domain-containing protein [Caldilineales bacterium]MDW8318799.1 DUF3592 domain-containing protein [Anaerolineae bacterium]